MSSDAGDGLPWVRASAVLSGGLIPGLKVIRGYRRAWLRADLVAGLTVFSVLIPSALAYGELAGVAPEAGLYAAVAAMLVYALLGSSRQLIVGPDASSALLTAMAVAPLAVGGDIARYIALAGALALVIGVVLIIAGRCRVGFVADFLSQPVLLGYMTGTALIIIASQLGKLFGIRLQQDDFFPRVWELGTCLSQTHPLTLGLGLFCVTVLLVLRRLAPGLPAPLLVVVLATVCSSLFGLAGRGVAVVGAIPTGLPWPSVPMVTIEDVRTLLPAAMSMALLSFADTVLTARSFASKRGYEVDANQELIALGAGNLGAGLAGGFPISSSSSRTAVNDSSGGQSQLAGVVAAALAIVFLLFFTPLLHDLPLAALAAIILVAAAGLIDVARFRKLRAIMKLEYAVSILTLFGVLIIGILPGILIAVTASLLLVIALACRPHDAVLGAIHGVDGFHEIDRTVSTLAAPGLIVYRFDAPMFFANTPYFLSQVRTLIASSGPPVACLLLDAETIGSLDTTAAGALSQLLDELDARGIQFAIARTNRPIRDMLERTGLTDRIGGDRFYPSVRTGVQAYLDHYPHLPITPS